MANWGANLILGQSSNKMQIAATDEAARKNSTHAIQKEGVNEI